MGYSSRSCRFSTNGYIFFVSAERFYVVVNPLQRSNLILQTEIDGFRKAISHQAKVNAAKSAHTICGPHNNNVLLASQVRRIFEPEMTCAGCVRATVIVNIDG